MAQDENCSDLLSKDYQRYRKFRGDVSEVLYLFREKVSAGAEANLSLAMELAKMVTPDEVGKKNIANEVVRIWYR